MTDFNDGIPSFDDYQATSYSTKNNDGIPSFDEYARASKPILNDSPFTSTLKSTGAHIVNSLAGQPVEDIGKLTGLAPVESLGRGVRQYAEGVQQANPSTINSLADVVARPLDAAKTALGNVAPQIPLSLGGAMAGARLGATFGPVGAAVGGGLGLFAPSYLQEYTEMRGKQHETGQEDMGKAALTAIPAAGLETVADATVLGRFLPDAVQKSAISQGIDRITAPLLAGGLKNRAIHAGKQALIGGGIEGGTEYTQTQLEQMGGNQPTDTPEARNEREVSAALGAIGGGIVRGGTRAFDPAQGPLSRAAQQITPSAAVNAAQNANPTGSPEEVINSAREVYNANVSPDGTAVNGSPDQVRPGAPASGVNDAGDNTEVAGASQINQELNKAITAKVTDQTILNRIRAGETFEQARANVQAQTNAGVDESADSIQLRDQSQPDSGALGVPSSRPPLANNLTQGSVTFKTAKGSSYTVHDDGTTTRDKAYRPEHGVKEQGIQPRSQRTFYVDEDGANKLSLVQTRGSAKTVLKLDDASDYAAVHIAYPEGVNKKSGIVRDTVTKIQRTPAVGLTPVEIWDDGNTVHFGNKIVDIKQPTQEEIQDETTKDAPHADEETRQAAEQKGPLLTFTPTYELADGTAVRQEEDGSFTDRDNVSYTPDNESRPLKPAEIEAYRDDVRENSQQKDSSEPGSPEVLLANGAPSQTVETQRTDAKVQDKAQFIKEKARLQSKYKGPFGPASQPPKFGSSEYIKDHDRIEEITTQLGQQRWQRTFEQINRVEGINKNTHRKIIEKALQAGRQVPESVLKDYPDLQNESPQANNPTNKAQPAAQNPDTPAPGITPIAPGAQAEPLGAANTSPFARLESYTKTDDQGFLIDDGALEIALSAANNATEKAALRKMAKKQENGDVILHPDFLDKVSDSHLWTRDFLGLAVDRYEAKKSAPTLAKSGKPFSTEKVAQAALKSSAYPETAATHEVVPVEGGYGLAPKTTQKTNVQAITPKNEAPQEKSRSQPAILTKTRKQYILDQKRQYLKDNPKAIQSAIDDAVKGFESNYESDYDKAAAAIPFAQYQALPANKGLSDGVLRQAHEQLQKDYGAAQVNEESVKKESVVQSAESAIPGVKSASQSKPAQENKSTDGINTDTEDNYTLKVRQELANLRTKQQISDSVPYMDKYVPYIEVFKRVQKAVDDGMVRNNAAQFNLEFGIPYDVADRIHAELAQQLKQQPAQKTPESIHAADDVYKKGVKVDTKFSRTESVKTAYERRIDELFAGAEPKQEGGITVLDSSDVLGLLGYGREKVNIVEGKVLKSEEVHHLTAEHWNKIPEWLDNPLAVFKSDTVEGRLVFIAPEMLNGNPILMIVDPNAKEGRATVNLLVNSYDGNTETMPIQRWVRQEKLLYIDNGKSRSTSDASRLQLPTRDQQNKPGSKIKILTEKNLVKYRDQNKFSQNQSATGSTVAELTAKLDAADKKLLQSGKLNIVQSVAEMPAHLIGAGKQQAESLSGFPFEVDTSVIKKPNNNSKFKTELFGNIFTTPARIAQLNHFFNRVIPLESANVPTSSLKDTRDGWATNAKLLGDIAVSPAFIKKGFSGIDIPTRRMVLKIMRLAINDDKIGNSIVESIPVDMMNLLGGKNLSSEMFFHDKSMLKDSLPINNNPSIPILVNRAVTELALSVADHAAIAFGSGNISLLPSERFSAKVADKGYSGLFGLEDASTGDRAKGVFSFIDPAAFSFNRSAAGGTIDDRHVTNSVKVGDVLGKSDVRASGLPSIISRLASVEALYDGKTKSIYLVADNLTSSTLTGVILHEKLHASLAENPKLRERLMGAQSELRDIFAQVEAGKYTGRYKTIYDAAMKRVDRAETSQDDRFEEWLAYQVTQWNKAPQSLPDRLAKAIQNLVAAIRAAIFKYTGRIDKIGPAELSALAKSMISYAESKSSDTTAQDQSSRVVHQKKGLSATVSTQNDLVNRQSNDIRYSLSTPEEVIIGDTGRQRTPEQLQAFKNLGRTITKPSLKERMASLWQDAGKKMAQGLVDQFRPVRDISTDAYMLMRLSKGASGAFETLLKGGQLKLNNGVYDFNESKKGGVVDRLLIPLQGEADDFMWWVAANRAEKLVLEDRENLFTPDDIAAMKTLADGDTKFNYALQYGPNKGKTTTNRSAIYADALKVFNEFNKNTLDMAEQSGLIDKDSRQFWESEFYVPFYRVDEEEGLRGMNIKSGVVRQEAFKHLKGGTSKLNADLLENTLMNWAHLLDAAAKNRAAKSTLEAASSMGVAEPVDAGTKNAVWFMDNGQRQHYKVNDLMVLEAITSLEYAGMRNPLMNVMGTMKYALTIGVTASPFFKVRNLIRDSIQSIATSELSYNPLGNIKEGYKLTAPKSDAYFRLLAGGGTIHFGTMLEGSESKRVRSLVEAGVDEGTILDNESKFKAFYKRMIEPAIDTYNEIGNRGEAVNRAALYAQLVKQGKSHAEASLMARDLMDFSMQGSWTSIRFLSQVVPFFNARLQGMYKLGRASSEDPRKMGTVLGATALASIALMLAYKDDDDWKKREDWDRDNYWWFKIGGEAFRIPKPFEIGALATVAERGVELFASDEMTGERFMDRLGALLSQNLSMNPVPQLVKPILDVYANKDSFTGRPIETMGMERLDPEYRYTQGTSMAARAASSVSGGALSPVQTDHLIRGYFGWLGSFIVSTADVLAKPATGQVSGAMPDYWKTITSGMVANTKDAKSRYVSRMYDQAKEIERAYGTWKHLQKYNPEEASEYKLNNSEKLMQYKKIERIKAQETKLNQHIRLIENSNKSADEKRRLIREINQQKDRIARMVQ